MPTAKKEAAVASLQDLMQRSSATIVTDYRGLKVADLTTLRRQLRDTNSEYHIAKNTLTSLAAKGAGIEGFDAQLEGPTALAFAFGDPSATARVLSDFARTSRILTVRGGLLDRKPISAEEVNSLATLESREILLARVLGGLNAPLANLVGVLQASISSVAYALQARINQLESGGAAAAAE